MSEIRAHTNMKSGSITVAGGVLFALEFYYHLLFLIKAEKGNWVTEEGEERSLYVSCAI